MSSFYPLAGNPLRSRADVVRALDALVAPLRSAFSVGAARVRLGYSAVLFPDAAEELEGFARPLWGLVPLALGGGGFGFGDLYRRGLDHGSDPDHPEYWGSARREQRMVEMAAIGFALAWLPDEVWEPLAPAARERLVRWLEAINQELPVENNWQFFRVMVNLGLARVGRFRAHAAQRESLERLESYALADGWYTDGPNGHVDWYLPWAFHTYGLLYAASGLGEPDVAARFRERARRFAPAHRHWFDPEGRALAYGRSQTYRFAQAAFWAALVFADEEALPWGEVKGLLLRHLRSWAGHPIAGSDGRLTLGYAYPSALIAEPYSSSGSPYWALKAFLCLVRGEDHPFWRAEETALAPHPEPVVQRPLRMALTRDAHQTLAVAAGQDELLFANGAARYAKLAYSSVFAFSVAGAATQPHHHVHDSALALREGDGPWRVRERVEAWRVGDDGLVWSRWRPWPDVDVETWLAGRCPWHWRVHRIASARSLHACEAGFALGWPGLEPGLPGVEVVSAPGAVTLRSARGVSGLFDRSGAREARMQPAAPGTNLVERRTVVPVLLSQHGPGQIHLACAVLASPDPHAAAEPSPPAELAPVLEGLAG